MSLEKAQQALLTSGKAEFETWPIPVCWENVAFTPPDGKPWLSVFFVPVNNQVETLGPVGTDREDGYLQIDVNYPLGTGESDMRAAIGKIKRCFSNGRGLTYESQPVTILSASCSGGRVVDGYYRKSITIRWRALTPRTTP